VGGGFLRDSQLSKLVASLMETHTQEEVPLDSLCSYSLPKGLRDINQRGDERGGGREGGSQRRSERYLVVWQWGKGFRSQTGAESSLTDTHDVYTHTHTQTTMKNVRETTTTSKRAKSLMWKTTLLMDSFGPLNKTSPSGGELCFKAEEGLMPPLDQLTLTHTREEKWGKN